MTQSVPQSYRPAFDSDFCERFEDPLIWRRDVRSFKLDPVSQALVGRLLDLVQFAPPLETASPGGSYRLIAHKYAQSSEPALNTVIERRSPASRVNVRKPISG
jgi:hypothetical protein